MIDADLGGGLIKQRIARAGQGRSGGYRTLLAFRTEDLAVFLFGFSKSQMDNVADDELKDLQLIASQWLNDTRKITKDWSAGILIEVKNDD